MSVPNNHLTAEDIKAIEKARKEFENGEVCSLEDIKREFKL